MNPPIDLMSGRKCGATADLARGALHLLSKVYGWAVNRRNRLYDRGARVTVRLDRPVISIGNITTGGTGKTPMCIWLAERLVEMGFRPAVVSRGYHARKDTPNDEMQLVSQRVPAAVCVANPHRIAAAEFAIEECGADLIIMDDGFQHRSLARDLDVVLIDATRPFGFDHLLPRGLLREPVENLRRADLFVITRADLVNPHDLSALAGRLKALAAETPVARSRHRRTGFLTMNGDLTRELETDPREVFLTAGIGNPEAFAAAATAHGLRVLGACWWPDHHHFREKDARYVLRQARRLGAGAIFTTEKDLVKLRRLNVDWHVPAYALRIEIEFLEDDSRMVLERVRQALDPFERRGDDP